jgi:hypothetical protein
MSEDPSNVPPPPGGYGAGPYREPGAPPPPSFEPPPPPRNTGRWAAGGIGLALVAVRACLLFARMSDPGPSYDYSYTPVAYPTYDPLAGLFADASPAAKLPKTGGQLALGPGEALAYDDSSGAIRDANGEVVCAAYCTTGRLAIVGKKVYWISFLDEELRSVSLVPGDTLEPPKKVAELHDPGLKLVTDGTALFTVDGSPGDDEKKSAIVRIDPATGKSSKLVTLSGVIQDLQAAGGRIYYTYADLEGDAPKVHVRSIGAGGGAATTIADLPADDLGPSIGSSAIGGGFYYLSYGGFAVADHVARFPIGGGARQVVYEASDTELLGPIAADAAGLWLVRRSGATWSISLVTHAAGATAETSTTKDVADELVEAPQALAVRAGSSDVVYTTFDGVFRTPKSPSK